MTRRLFIADDEPLVRERVIRLLAGRLMRSWDRPPTVSKPFWVSSN